jgi:hypothetical protein
VDVADGVAVSVAVGVEVTLAVEADVAVAVAVAVGVAAPLPVAVPVGVGVAVGVGDSVAVAVVVGDGPINPTPASFTFCGLFAAASVNSRKPFLNLPFDGGMKVTETVQLPPAAIGPTQLFESRLKPVPLTLTAGADSSTLLRLTKVTILGLLCVPAGRLPKLIFLGDSPTAILLLVAEGLVCALARSPSANKLAQIAIATTLTRRDEITRRGIYQLPVFSQ